MTGFLILIVLILISCNIFQIFKHRKLKSQNQASAVSIADLTLIKDEQLKKLSEVKERKPSLELEEFLSDLYAGGGLLRVTRIDQTNLFVRSPRDR